MFFVIFFCTRITLPPGLSVFTNTNRPFNINTFINFNDVRLAASLANTRPEILREVLTVFSALATDQYKAHTADEVKIETRCKSEELEELIVAIKKAHPYEEVCINVIPLL